MYINISYKFHRIPNRQSRFITKVHDLLGQPSYIHTLFWLLVSLKLSPLYIYVHYSDYWSVWHSPPSIYVHYSDYLSVWRSLPSIYVHYFDYWSVWHSLPSIYTYIILTTGQFDTLCPPYGPWCEETFWGCEQHRRRPACASAQSDQRLCYSHFEKNHM